MDLMRKEREDKDIARLLGIRLKQESREADCVVYSVEMRDGVLRVMEQKPQGKNMKKKKAMQLKSVKEEAADCRAAFKGSHIGDVAFHIHHRILGEHLDEPAANRIAYIIKYKPAEEQPVRLRCFRPIPQSKLPVKIKKAIEAYRNAKAASNARYCAGESINALLRVWLQTNHSRLCHKDCPWNGTEICDAAF